MTYTVDVKGILEIIQTPPEESTKDWQDFKISLSKNKKTVHVELHNRTPWYNDVVAKAYVLGHFYIGVLKGRGEDGSKYEFQIPPTTEDIIEASERQSWNPEFCVYQKAYGEHDRFFAELQSIGYESLYPSWLSQIKKVE